MIIKRLISIWSGFLPGSREPDTTSVKVRMSRVVHSFSIIGVLPLLIFGIVNFLRGSVAVGLFELVVAGFFIANIIHLHRTLDYQRAGTLVLSFLLSVLLMLLVTGGLEQTGIYWCFAFPTAAFFIKGKRGGMLWILGFLGAVLLLSILSRTNYIVLSYNSLELRQFMVSLGVGSGLIYAYYHFVEAEDRLVLEVRERQLLDQNNLLRSKLDEQHEAQLHQQELIETIDKTITQVQTKNADLENAKLAMLNVLEDLENERRRTEENEQKDEAILESIGEGMIATDADNKIIVANRQAEELLGYTTKELIGSNYFERVIPVVEDGSPLPLKDRPFSLALKTGKAVNSTTLQYQRKDKTVFPVAITASPIEIGGKQIGGIAVFRDITKEKQIDKAKTEFVSLASHQLRTPLSAIGWYVEMLLSGDAGKLAKEQVDYLREIQHGSKRLVEMVNSLLNVSRIELGTFMVEPKPTKPIEIAEAVLGEVKSLIEQKQFKLTKQFDKDIPVMNLDPHLLEIVLQNLISNAVKYTPIKGSITISLAYDNKALTITVTDTGIGIPKDQLGRIFEKLFRADNVRATDTDGTGLGLYMVKQILEEIGGKVELRSVLNKGTTVTVHIPSIGMMPRKGTKRLA
ncbi:MAG: PAS domain-containing sensor histidine kinase [Patescibacteria group bacterium]